jgi:hypothetical protein
MTATVVKFRPRRKGGIADDLRALADETDADKELKACGAHVCVEYDNGAICIEWFGPLSPYAVAGVLHHSANRLIDESLEEGDE